MPNIKSQTENANDQKYYVYVVRCSDGSLYTGIAADVAARVQCHNNGTGAKYTRSRLPVELVYTEKKINHKEAAQRESEIKKWPKKHKEELVNSKL